MTSIKTLYRDDNDYSAFYVDGQLVTINGTPAEGDLYAVWSQLLNYFGIEEIYDEESNFLLGGVSAANDTEAIDQYVANKKAQADRAAQIDQEIKRLQAEKMTLVTEAPIDEND